MKKDRWFDGGAGAADDTIRVFVEAPGSSVTSDAPSFTQDVVVDKAHQGDVNCVRWNPVQGGVLASCGDDHLVKIWTYRPFGE